MPIWKVQIGKLIRLRVEGDMKSGPFQELYIYLYLFSGLFTAYFFLPSVYIKDNSTENQLKPDLSLPVHRLKLSAQDNFCTSSSSWLPNPKLCASTPSSFQMHHCYSFKVS